MKGDDRYLEEEEKEEEEEFRPTRASPTDP